MLGNIHSAGDGHQRYQCDARNGDSGFGHSLRFAAGLLHHRKPRIYQNNAADTDDNREGGAAARAKSTLSRNLVAAVAIAVFRAASHPAYE